VAAAPPLVRPLLWTRGGANMKDVQASSQCARCIFKMAGKHVCVAFPRGIPADIIGGRFDHSQPHEGDGGIRFVSLRERTVNRQPALPESR
jgi:hypothetical protein